MKYCNAKDVFPPDVLELILPYARGRLVYFGKSGRKPWGSSGARQALQKRNAAICAAYAGGMKLEALAARCYLAPETLCRILRQGRKKRGETYGRKQP